LVDRGKKGGTAGQPQADRPSTMGFPSTIRHMRSMLSGWSPTYSAPIFRQWRSIDVQREYW